MPDPDPLTAELAAIRERTGRPVPDVTSLPISHRGVQALMAAAISAADVPRLLAAVEAAAAFHQPGPFALLGALCPEHEACRNFSITSSEADRVAACPKCSATVQRTCTHGDYAIWPCAEYRAIARELLGKEAGSGD